MKNMKKNIVYLALTVAVIVGIVAAGHSIAYFIAQQNQELVFEVATVDTTIDEEFTPDPEEPSSYIKTPRVTNHGSVNAIVRVRVEPTNYDLINSGDMIISKDGKEIVLGQNIMEGNDVIWLYNSDDGYYYYQGIVEPGKSTPTLFDRVTISDTAKFTDMDIIILSDAIQTQAFNEDGELVIDAENGGYDHDAAMQLWQQFSAE